MNTNRRKFIESFALTGAAVAISPLLRAAEIENVSEFKNDSDRIFADRNLKLNCIYPPDVFLKGGTIILMFLCMLAMLINAFIYLCRIK